MKARCVKCQHVFPVLGIGTQTCPSCGARLNLDLPGAPCPPASAPSSDSPSSSGAGACGFGDAGGCGGSHGGAPDASNYGNSYGGGYFGSAAHPLERPTPWEKRGEQGTFNAFASTVSLSLKSPGTFFRHMPLDNADGALTYYWAIRGIVTVAMVLANLGAFYAFGLHSGGSPLQALQWKMGGAGDASGSAFLDAAAGLFARLPGGGFLEFLAISASFIVPSLLAIPFAMLVQSAFIHVGCLVVGAGSGGFKATLRAVGYSCTPLLMGVIPICGNLVGTLMAFIYLVTAVAIVHGIGKVRAFFAIVLPPAFATFLCVLARLIWL